MLFVFNYKDCFAITSTAQGESPRTPGCLQINLQREKQITTLCKKWSFLQHMYTCYEKLTISRFLIFI